MLKLKLAGLLGAAATTTALVLAAAPAATAAPLPTCAETIEQTMTYNTAAIDANLRHDSEAALDANQDAQGYEISAIVVCLGQGLRPLLNLVSATLSNAQAMTANDRGPSGEGAALAAERKVDLALQAALKALK